MKKTFIYAPSYQSFFLIFYLYNKNKDLLVITCNKPIISFCKKNNIWQ